MKVIYPDEEKAPQLEKPNGAARQVLPVVSPDPGGSALEPGANELTPADQAERTALWWRRSFSGLFAAAGEAEKAWKLWAKDPVKMGAYARALNHRGMLTKREAADPSGSATLSRMRKIFRFKAELGRFEVVRHVGPSLSKLAICASIMEVAEGSPAQKSNKLVEILIACPNEEVDRRYLSAALKKLTRENNASEKSDARDISEAVPRATSWAALKESKIRFDRVLVTPTAKQKRLLTESRAHPERIEHHLPLRDVLAKDAAIIIAAKVADLPDLAEHSALGCGAKGRPKIVLTTKPKGADITNEPVLILLQRGAIEHNEDADPWAGTGDPADVAARLYPGGKWLHVFADKEHDGTTSLVGDHGWVDAAALDK